MCRVDWSTIVNWLIMGRVDWSTMAGQAYYG